MALPKKTEFWDDLPLCPNPPDLKNANIFVCRRLAVSDQESGFRGLSGKESGTEFVNPFQLGNRAEKAVREPGSGLLPRKLVKSTLFGFLVCRRNGTSRYSVLCDCNETFFRNDFSQHACL